MDLFVNGYDEPRLSIPYELKQQLLALERANKVRPTLNETLILRSFGGTPSLFDKVRKACPSGEHCPTAFEQLRLTCAPSSPARHAQLSTSPGADPHISQRYTKPFTTARGHLLVSPKQERSSWCEQPDVADLHAAYIHPLSFTYTNQMFPVFSNSKVGGFDDVLVPSWWYWVDQSPYRPQDDVAWEKKHDNVRCKLFCFTFDI